MSTYSFDLLTPNNSEVIEPEEPLSRIPVSKVVYCESAHHCGPSAASVSVELHSHGRLQSRPLWKLHSLLPRPRPL